MAMTCVVTSGPACGQESAPGSPRTTEGLVLPFREVLVSAPAQKVVDAIKVEEGRTVREGDVLALLDARVEELDMQRFAKILEKREFENRAAASLAKEKFISKDEELERSLELDIARLQFEAAKAECERLTIRSPIDGVVVEKLKEAGESVTESEPMFKLLNVERVYVQFYLPAEDVFLLKPGDVLEVRFPLLPEDRQVHRGTVDFVSAEIDASSRLLRIKLVLDNPDGLIKAGMRGSVVLPAPPRP